MVQKEENRVKVRGREEGCQKGDWQERKGREEQTGREKGGKKTESKAVEKEEEGVKVRERKKRFQAGD